MIYVLGQTFVQNCGNIVSDMSGEKVMLSIEKGKYYNLGEIGGVIWELMKKPMTLEQIISKLVSEYDVDQSQCKEEVVSFLESLVKEDLIHTEKTAI